MESDLLNRLDARALAALLAWQVELGADEAIGDVPVDAYALPADPPWRARPPAPGPAMDAPPPAPAGDGVARARGAAAAAGDLAALRAALAGFEGCELKKGARHTVFADGVPGAAVMVVGDAPDRDDDRAGAPFSGRAGALLDRMFQAIGLARDGQGDGALYLTHALPWFPPEGHPPRPGDIAVLAPFLHRHIALARPRVVVAMGNLAAQALLGKGGILRLRGQWQQAQGLPVLPMLPPAALLRTPSAKREAWADLLALRAHLARPG